MRNKIVSKLLRKLAALPRDVAIRSIRKLGRAEWKRQVGYHRRSLAETAMYRMKTLFGAMLKKRSDEAQKTEARVRCKILNHFTKLGMPKFTYDLRIATGNATED